MPGRRRIVGSFGTWRGGIVGGVLESCHARSLRASVVARGWCRRQLRLALVLILHLLHLGLALDFGFESGLSVGVDRLLREIVCSAASYRGVVSRFFTHELLDLFTGTWPAISQ